MYFKRNKYQINLAIIRIYQKYSCMTTAQQTKVNATHVVMVQMNEIYITNSVQLSTSKY